MTPSLRCSASPRRRRRSARCALHQLPSPRVDAGRPADGAGDRRHDLLALVVLRRRRSPPARPSRSTMIRSATSKTSARLWLITTTPEAALAQALDQVEHLRGLGDAERGGGLVEEHHLRLAEQRAGDRHRLALAAGEAADLGAHAAERSSPTSSSSSSRHAAPSRSRRASAAGCRRRRPPPGRGRGWRRRRGCRTGRGPGSTVAIPSARGRRSGC